MAASLIRHLRTRRLAHRWVRVVRENWTFARCVRCGKERELTEELFLTSFGQKPPPLHPSAK